MYPCEIKEQEAQHTLTVRFRAPVQDLPKHFGEAYGAIGAYLGELQAEHDGPAFALYHNMEMQNLDIEAGFMVKQALPAKDKIQAGKIPAGTYAVCHYVGPYDKCGPAYEQLTKFVKEQGYEPSGLAYEFFFDGPEVPPEKLRTDIVFPVTKIKEKDAA